MTTNEHQTMTQPSYLIAGGAGTTGRRVADRLGADGHHVRLASRSTSPALDWHDPATFPAVLDGVTAAYIAYSPDIAMPGAAEELAGFAAAARQAGVQRLVVLSGRGETEAIRSVGAIRSAGVPTTALYASWFAQNFSESFLLGGVLGGEIALPAADVPEPFLDLDDLAEVAVLALTTDADVGQDYQLTGPQGLTFAAAGGIVGVATGREVGYRTVSEDEFIAASVAEGVPPEVAAGLAALFAEVLDGRNSSPTDDVQRLLGRPPTSLEEFARRAAAAGAWAPSFTPGPAPAEPEVSRA